MHVTRFVIVLLVSPPPPPLPPFFPSSRQATASEADADKTGPMMWVGVALLFVSLCFDGATGAYEDELMQVGRPVDLLSTPRFPKYASFFCVLFCLLVLVVELIG